jgi:hypothetical protein
MRHVPVVVYGGVFILILTLDQNLDLCVVFSLLLVA